MWIYAVDALVVHTRAAVDRQGCYVARSSASSPSGTESSTTSIRSFAQTLTTVRRRHSVRPARRAKGRVGLVAPAVYASVACSAPIGQELATVPRTGITGGAEPRLVDERQAFRDPPHST